MRNQYLLSSIRLLFIVLSPLLLTVMTSETQEPMTSPPYSVQEISSLTNLYELRIKMNYLPEGCLRYPPHSPPLISTEHILSKVLDPKIAEVMQGIPYIDSTNESDPKILFDSTTASYIDKGVLEESRTLYLPPDDSGGELLEPWVMPLTLAGQAGYHALFDAKSGELIKWKWMEAAPSSQNHDYQYRNFPSVHITQFLKGIIDDYQTLRCVPFSYGISPAGDPTTPYLAHIFRNASWPDHIDSDILGKQGGRFAEWEVNHEDGCIVEGNDFEKHHEEVFREAEIPMRQIQSIGIKNS